MLKKGAETAADLNVTETPENDPRNSIVASTRLVLGAQSAAAEKLLTPSLSQESFRSKEISPALAQEVADFYRWLFGNSMHFAVCPPCEAEGKGARMTAREVFGTGDEYVSAKDVADLEKLPDCPCCSKEMKQVYDRLTLSGNFNEKLRNSPDSFLTLLRDPEENIQGLAFAYLTDLERELDLEWGYVNNYMRTADKRPEDERDLKDFMASVRQIYSDSEIEDSELVLAWNCVSVSPKHASRGNMIRLVSELFAGIPESENGLKVLGDVKRDSVAHQFFRKLQGKAGEGFFEKEEDILIGGHVGIIKGVLGVQGPGGNKQESSAPISPERTSDVQPVGGSVSADWDKLAEDYETQVYSITKPDEKRARIISEIQDGNEVLIAGCGSEVHLPADLLAKCQTNVTATDFSKEMLRVSRSRYTHPNLNHVLADTRALPFNDRFDRVISTNSIVPPRREDVVGMYTSIYNSLKEGGRFLAYLPSFDLCTRMIEKYEFLRGPFEERMDREQARFMDTVGWQCFHTEKGIPDELERAGFKRDNIELSVVGCENEEEARDLGLLYGLPIDMIKDEFMCYFVSATK